MKTQRTDYSVSRREFIHTTAVVAAWTAIGIKPTHILAAGNPRAEDTKKILNYNPDMEYRLCGKTGWMVSAVCLGGHWKRVDQMVPGIFGKGSWLSADLNNKEFQKNRYDVVTRCIERGINYVDACCREEILAYAKAVKGRRHKVFFGYSWHVKESRLPDWRPAKALHQGRDDGGEEAGRD